MPFTFFLGTSMNKLWSILHLLKFLFFMCLCSRVCVRTCIWMGVEARSWHWVFSVALHFVFEATSLIELGDYCFWPMSTMDLLSFFSLFPDLGYSYCSIGFLCGCHASDSGPHVYVAGTLHISHIHDFFLWHSWYFQIFMLSVLCFSNMPVHRCVFLSCSDYFFPLNLVLCVFPVKTDLLGLKHILSWAGSWS